MKLGTNDTGASSYKVTEWILQICINYDNCVSFSDFNKFLSRITAIIKSVFLVTGSQNQPQLFSRQAAFSCITLRKIN